MVQGQHSDLERRVHGTRRVLDTMTTAWYEARPIVEVFGGIVIMAAGSMFAGGLILANVVNIVDYANHARTSFEIIKGGSTSAPFLVASYVAVQQGYELLKSGFRDS